jgi:predicted nucleic acid-binding protein
MAGINRKVVDASACVAVIFSEPEGKDAAARMTGALFAPAILEFEIVNVCVVKMRRNPEQRSALLRAFATRRGLKVETRAVDHEEVLELAQRSGLSGYDASYLWLARNLNAELVTLDRKLARAAEMKP